MGGGTQIELQTKKMKGLKLAADGDPHPPSPEDRLSSLPVKTLTTIISFLPLKEAARTSILSPRWRHLWTFAPLDLLIADGTAIETVSLILSRHRGPVRSFRLPASIWHPLGPNLLMVLYGWINALIQRGVQALALCYCLPPQLLACESLRSLEFMDALLFEHGLPRNLRELKLGPSALAKGRPKLPPGLLTCEFLRSLELWFYCFDYSPAEMEAMMPLPVNLRELTLCKLGFTESALSHVLSKCHFLDSLRLDECLCLNGLRVCSPSLLKLTVRDLEMAGGEFLVEDAPNLEMLMFSEYSTEHMVVKIVNAPKLQVLGYIDSHVGMLEFVGACFQNRIVTKCSTRPNTLKTLAISVNLDGASDAKTIANLLNLFPCLENLCIAIDCSDPSAPTGEAPAYEEFWDGQTSSSCLDYHLKTVSIKGFLGTPNHLALARLFVCNARVIKEIYLLFDFGLESWEELVKHELLHENKASADLQIIFGRDCDNHPKFSTGNAAFQVTFDSDCHKLTQILNLGK